MPNENKSLQKQSKVLIGAPIAVALAMVSIHSASAMGERASNTTKGFHASEQPGELGTNAGSGPESYRNNVGGSWGTSRQPNATSNMESSSGVAGSGGTDSSQGGHTSAKGNVKPLNNK